MDNLLRELKVWHFFSVLEEDERKSLLTLLVGSAKNDSNDVLRTFRYLISHQAEIESGKLTRGDLFQFLHGELPFNVNQFNKPVSRLINRIKDFWQYGAGMEGPSESTESMVERKLRLMRKLETNGLNSEYDYERTVVYALFSDQYFFEDKFRQYAAWKKIELEHNMRLHPHESRPELREMQQALRRQFEFDRIRIEASIVNQQKMSAHDAQQLEEDSFALESDTDEPIIQFYRTFIALQRTHTVERWAELKSLFDLLPGKLSHDLLADAASLLISHASRARNAGSSSIQGELLTVYQQILDSGALESANWNIGSHLQNYLFLVGHQGDRDKAIQLLMLAETYREKGKIRLSTGWLLKAIFEEFFGDRRKAYKYYNECLSARCSTLEEVIARSKQLILDYEDRHATPILPDFGHTYEVFLKRNLGSYPALRNHLNFVACARILAAASCEIPGSPPREKKIQKCRNRVSEFEVQPLLHKDWLLRQLDILNREK